MLRSTQPLCTKCHREPRYPRQRWGPRCFALYHRDRRAPLRRERAGNRSREEATTFSIRRPSNATPPLFEQLKRVVLEVPKFRNRPETIRVSLLPSRAHMYVDLRVIWPGSRRAKASRFTETWCQRSWMEYSGPSAPAGTRCHGSGNPDRRLGRRAFLGRRTSGNRRPLEDSHNVGTTHGATAG
jgi:hypothetical protein